MKTYTKNEVAKTIDHDVKVKVIQESAFLTMEQGADRLGVGSTQAVLEGSESKDNY